MTLMRGPRPSSLPSFTPSMTKNLSCLSMICLLHLLRQSSPDLVFVVGAVEQEGRTLLGILEHVVLLEEGEVVTGDEVGTLDQVGLADRLFAEAQVRRGHAAGLLGVINEVSLNFVVGAVADNLDRVLVRPNRAVGAETIEHRRVTVEGDNVVRVEIEAAAGDVVLDADHVSGSSACLSTGCRKPPWPCRG